MGKFDAGTAVEAMEYDFTKYGGGAGIIPEPSGDVLDEFMQALAASMSTVQDVTNLGEIDTTDGEAVAAALAAIKDQDTIKQVDDELTELVARLTQGQPSADDIATLPFRVKQAFIGWLVGQLNPQAEAPASNA